MEYLTWEDVRKILNDSGDSASLKEPVVLRADGEFFLSLVIDAKAGTLAFNYTSDSATE